MTQLFKPTELNDPRLGYFRSTNINQNVSPDLIATHIKPTELYYLQKLLGRKMYADMVSKRIAGEYLPDTSNVNFPPVNMFPPIEIAYNELFNNYIWGYFGKALTFIVQSTATVMITDAGTQEPEKLATIRDRQMRADTINKQLEILRADIIAYLCENKANFPLWEHPSGKTCGYCCSNEPAKPRLRIVIF